MRNHIKKYEKSYQVTDLNEFYRNQTLAPPTRRPVRNRRSGHSSAVRNRWLC